MTTTEIVKYNYSEVIKKRFREKDFEFKKFPSNKKGVYSSIERLTDFVQDEVDFWEKLRGKPGSYNDYKEQVFGKVIAHFKEVRKALVQCENLEDSNSYNYKSKVEELDRQLAKLQMQLFPNVFSQSEFASLIKRAIDKGYSNEFIAGYFSGYFKERILSNVSSHLEKKDFFIGFNYGVRKRYPEHFKEVDEGFIEHTESLIQNLNNEYNEFTDHIEARTKSLENRFDTLEKENESNINRSKDILDELKTTKETELNDLILFKENKMKELEDLYGEKLKLSEPAEYWRLTSESYKKRGWIWSTIAGFTGLAVMIILFLVLRYTTVSDEWNLESVKFTVILTVIISIGFLLVNLTIKLALSNFHLSIDATERHKLTYLYLALLNEDKDSVSEKEKSIVFQALFARSDSGLTKSDCGVQMPNANQLLELHKK